MSTDTEKMITTARHCLAYEMSRDETVEQLMHVYHCPVTEAFHVTVAAEILERHSQAQDRADG